MNDHLENEVAVTRFLLEPAQADEAEALAAYSLKALREPMSTLG